MGTMSENWSKPWIPDISDKAFRIWHFLVRIAALVILFLGLSSVLRWSTRLPEESYQKPVIYLAFLENILTRWPWSLLLVALLIAIIFYRKKLSCSWDALPDSRFVRFLVILATVVLAWAFATYDFNLYFDRAHYADRILLTILIPLIYWRPGFVLLFLSALFPVTWQFATLPGYSWAAALIPLNMLILFSAFFLVYVVSGIFRVKDFAFLAGCLFAANYWLSGYGKLTVDWLMHDRIYFLLPATYANGWLAGLEPGIISSIVQKIAVFNWPLKMLIFGIEIGMFFFFCNSRLTRFLIAGTVIMHAGIFLVSGIYFWMWSVMGIGLFICFSRKDAFRSLPIFSTMHIITSMILIAGGIYWCNPPRLAWYDTPVSYAYRFKAIGESGRTYHLPPGFFAPYDYQFTLGKFNYISNLPCLPITWGATQDSELAQKLEKMNSMEVLKYESVKGAIHLDTAEAMAFDRFLKEYMHHWNERLSNHTWLSNVQAPRQLWTYAKGSTFEIPERIDYVLVTRVTSFFEKNEYKEIEELPIRTVKI